MNHCGGRWKIYFLYVIDFAEPSLEIRPSAPLGGYQGTIFSVKIIMLFNVINSEIIFFQEKRCQLGGVFHGLIEISVSIDAKLDADT